MHNILAVWIELTYHIKHCFLYCVNIKFTAFHGNKKWFFPDTVFISPIQLQRGSRFTCLSKNPLDVQSWKNKFALPASHTEIYRLCLFSCIWCWYIQRIKLFILQIDLSKGFDVRIPKWFKSYSFDFSNITTIMFCFVMGEKWIKWKYVVCARNLNYNEV